MTQGYNERWIIAELLAALKAILAHVEDENVVRQGAQCTLCHTYRMIGHAAIDRAEGR